MRLAVIILTLLGCLAAGAAVILVNLAIETKAEREVEVLVAAEDLPPLSKIEASHVKRVPVAKTAVAVEQGHLADPIEAIGKVLSTSVSKGQLITTSCFLSDEEAELFSTEIPEGMRALTISLPTRSVMSGLLYPHCKVDIFGVFNLKSKDEGEAMSKEILQGVEILAVENKTEFSEGDKGNQRRPRSSSSSVRVTFALTPDQTKVLQLSLSKGDIYVALRNPRNSEIGQVRALYIDNGNTMPGISGHPDPDPSGRHHDEQSPDPSKRTCRVEVIRGGDMTITTTVFRSGT